MWQDKQAHNGSSWKTCAVCSPPTKVMPSGKSSMRWLKEGSMQDGHVYEPTNPWVPAIGGIVGSQLPTPVVNDMGAGKTVEKWDSWTAEMKAKHGNGNGHGKSLSIEVQRLLPTQTAQDGATMPPPSPDGSSPADDPPPPQ